MKGPIGNTTRQATRDKKKRNGESERKKSSTLIVFVFESAVAGCGIPNDSFAGIIHAVQRQSIGSLFVIFAAPETLWQTKRKLSTWLIFILASKFIRIPAFLNGISRSCALFNTSRRRQRWKIMPLLAREESHWLTTMKYARREENKWRQGEKKKMWVHHVCKWECRRRLRHPKRLPDKLTFPQIPCWHW